MPIRKDLLPFYRGPGWATTRQRILKRAHNRCEQCGKPNRRAVWTYRSDTCGQLWSLSAGSAQAWIYCLYGGVGNFRLTGAQAANAANAGRMRVIRVVLTVAHLNHVAGDDRDDNLRALCQWCHLHLDALHHKQSRSARKDRSRPLLMEAHA